MRFQRAVQIPVLALFIWLLILDAFPPPGWVEVDLFLRLDPLLSSVTMIAERAFVARLAWAALILAAGVVLGRFFCGYVCPMGTSVDLADRLMRRKRRDARPAGRAPAWRRLKYLLLAGVLGAALAGFSAVFLFSPLALITRFYGLVIYPLLLQVLGLARELIQPLSAWFGWEGIRYLQISTPVFSTRFFVALFFAAVFLAGLISPRFWCRNLCPAGALMALCARKPLLRRRVSEDCTRCGKCARNCPMGAIREDFFTTDHQECVTCLKCREVCPVGAVSFGRGGSATGSGPAVDLSRRRWLEAGISGFAVGVLTLSGPGRLFGGGTAPDLRFARLVRPPGSLPEADFLTRCVRCGECVKGCATNTLQAIWFEGGLDGIWTPKVRARLAACEQFCTLCGEVCPTGAIRPLPLEEKMYAKIGTARIIHSRCIAWEQEKACLICDEICPYNAITTRFAPGLSVTVPFINENRCNGCGYCESKCPVLGEAAIVVEIQGEVRLAAGSYSQLARERGLVLDAKRGVEETVMGSPGGTGTGERNEPVAPAEPKLPSGFEVERPPER